MFAQQTHKKLFQNKGCHGELMVHERVADVMLAEQRENRKARPFPMVALSKPTAHVDSDPCQAPTSGLKIHFVSHLSREETVRRVSLPSFSFAFTFTFVSSGEECVRLRSATFLPTVAV